MKKLYIIFDQMPRKTDGGLLQTYINLNDLLKNKYDIKIVSIFNYNDEGLFKDNEKIIINNYNIDNRFYKAFKYLFKGDFKNFNHAIKSFFIYFTSKKKNQKKLKNIINDDDNVIATCPSAAIFISKEIKFILEIHIDYKYFFGKNILGRLQSNMMTKPTLTLFRTKYDSLHVPKYLNSSYIYNFFDNANIKRNNKLVKNKICFVGRISDQKDPLRLIDIAYELKKINNDFILDIYGTGDLENKVKEKIKNLGLEENVFMKGFINNKNIYANYSLLWMTSKFEGFGLVIIEAKANGIPSISTNWGESLKEVINDGNDGYIIDDNKKYAEKTNEILSNEKLQKKLSDNAYKNFDKFSKEKAYKNWIKILENYKK